MKLSVFLFCTICLTSMGALLAQVPLTEEWRSPRITAIKLFKNNDQMAFPIIRVGETETLELHFDDLQTSSRNYFYTYLLCNADWTPVNLSNMDYIKGFTQVRINQYRFSSATTSRYVHYQALLPAANCQPSRSGNYLLKVFENGDTSKLLFSRKILVLNEKSTVAATIQQPFAREFFMTHQKITVNVSFNNLDVLNPAQEIKVVVMQNNRWDNARLINRPTFIRGKSLEYSDEQMLIFESGKEWRWLDLRSFRLQSDRVSKVDYTQTPYEVFLKTDTIRSPIRYQYYRDINGRFAVAHLENINPWWQSDFARVHFTFLPKNREILKDQDVYLFGEMTNYQLNSQTRLIWNEESGTYENTLLLKNGFYNYNYVTAPQGAVYPKGSFHLTEGNIWETENDYRIMVYYTPFGSRSDELIGIGNTNTLNFFPRNR